MRARPEDLVDELSGQGGVPFQNFVYDLVVAEARQCHIPMGKIRFDSRVNIADGGRDIIVGSNTRRTLFLPKGRSIWSVKSGADGLESSTLRKEIKAENHPELQEH